LKKLLSFLIFFFKFEAWCMFTVESRAFEQRMGFSVDGKISGWGREVRSIAESIA
jgi:hypothetical protein